MEKTEKEELKEYKEHLKREADKFKMSAEDLANLYDLMEIADTPSEIDFDFKITLKENKMLGWFKGFRERVERIVVPELYEK